MEGRERDLCWLINNAWFIHNQLGLRTQSMSCIMRSQAISLVQQQHYSRPKNPANYRPAEPSHNIKILGSALHWAADMEGFSEASLTVSPCP